MLTTSIWSLLAQLFCQLHVVIVWNGMALLPYTLFLGQFGLGLAVPARTDLTKTCWDEITYTRDPRQDKRFGNWVDGDHLLELKISENVKGIY